MYIQSPLEHFIHLSHTADADQLEDGVATIDDVVLGKGLLRLRHGTSDVRSDRIPVLLVHAYCAAVSS